jgi:DNA replication and repair protein RecF
LSSPSPDIAKLAIEHISLRELRNVQSAELAPAARLNVITGDNGQGKTSVLEAIYLVATSRSFRTPKLAEVVRHGASVASIRAVLSEGPRAVEHDAACEPSASPPSVRREQTLGIQNGRRTLRLDGEPPSSLGYYATRSPVVVFDPQQMSLSTGPSAGRRTLLDRIALFAHPVIGNHAARYRRALQARQTLLGTDLGRCAQPSAELDAFEALLATHGAALTVARRQAAAELAGETRAAFHAIGAPELELGLAFQPGGSDEPEQARRELRDRRPLDARRRRTSFGPHLDDLGLELGGHPIRAVGSQGQHRSVTLALKIAELRCIARARQLEPILLLDDVSSELDPTRALALFAYLGGTACQIFLTTTRHELIVAPSLEGAERQDFRVQAGRISPVG